MRSGRLDRRITIQRSTVSYGTDGHEAHSWSSVGVLRRPASLTALRGEERFTAPQYVAKEQVEFRIRFDGDVEGVSPLDRIIYPALEADSPVDSTIETRRLYDIIAVHEIGRREGLRILAARRSDVVA